MRKRNKRIWTHLSIQEYDNFKKNIAKTELTQEAYIRTLIAGYVPKEHPPVEYHNLLRELRIIGKNINQICARLNAYGSMDVQAYQENLNMLHSAILEIRSYFELPEKQA